MVNQLLNRSVNNPFYLRVGFVIFLLLSVIMNSFLLKEDSHLYVLYIFSVIFLGMGFYDKPTWFLSLFTAIVVICRYFLIPEPNSQLSIFLIHFITYFLITLISAGLVKHVYKVKKDHLGLTRALANALDSRDPYTMHHSENVAKYSLLIAKKMNLSKNMCKAIHTAALLHDLGKIGIPEMMLMKNGKLTDEEYEVIKKHPTIGYEMVKHIADFHNNGILDTVLYHHERYDGKGYPKGLKGNEIPLMARIVAVADSFDAMTTKRVYRYPLDLNYTLSEMRKNKGTQFDPDIVDVFLSLFESEPKVKGNYEKII